MSVPTMTTETHSADQLPGLIAQIKENLSKRPEDWRNRRALVTELGKVGEAGVSEDQDEVLETMAMLLAEDEIDEVRRSAVAAIQGMWNAGWGVRRQAVLEQVEQVLCTPSFELRKAAVEWLGANAEEIARNNRLTIQVLDMLIKTASDDADAQVRVAAWESSKQIWQAGWRAKENQGSYRMTIFSRFLKILKDEDEDEQDWEVRKAFADWLGEWAADIAKDDRMMADTLDTLVSRPFNEDTGEIKRSAGDAIRMLLNEGWRVQPNFASRRLVILDRAEKALGSGDQGLQQMTASWLGEQAVEIAENDQMLDKALAMLLHMASQDPQEFTRRCAEDSLRTFLRVGWRQNAGQPSRQLIILNRVLDALHQDKANGPEAKEAAVNWLEAIGEELASDGRVVEQVQNALVLGLIGSDDILRLRILGTLRKIWDAGWALNENRAAQRQGVLDRVLKEMKLEDETNWVVKLVAAEWLGEHAPAIAEEERMVKDALKALSRWIMQKDLPELMRSAQEASKKIWNAAIKSQRQAVVEQILKYSEEQSAENGVWEFHISAINWLGDWSKEIAQDYDLSEKVATSLDYLRKDPSQPTELRESASKSLLSLWDSLQKTYSLSAIKRKFDREDEDLKVKTIRKLANKNTLGSREAVGFLVKRWVDWIREDAEKPLVELTAEALRNNEFAVLPLVEQLVIPRDEGLRLTAFGLVYALQGRKSYYDQEQQEKIAAKHLRIRRRIARQLADMSNPGYFSTPDQSRHHEKILKELRDHAVPALSRQLSDEWDIEIMENIARTLLYIREREGIDAVAKEVIGEERTRKARQELLAKYYLEPSKARSDQAADILKKAIRESKRTLRVLQGLNILVILVGLAIIVAGLWLSMFEDQAATRIAGGLASIGGLTGVVYQLVRDPLNRIQRSSSNLVQMETAFTSFIWELNLNGTYIQSSYVDRGELSEQEIRDTSDRIEEAMRLTMELVSIHTEEGKQRLVTRINRLEPPAGSAGSRVIVHGQHLLGEFGQAKTRSSSTDLSRQPALGGISGNGKHKNAFGMVAINHTPVDTEKISWRDETVEFRLPVQMGEMDALHGTVMISLFVDGMETNALPFHVSESH